MKPHLRIDTLPVVSCRIQPDLPLTCGSLVERRLCFTVLQPIAPGGAIRIHFTQSPDYQTPPAYGLPAKGFVFFARIQFQVDDPGELGYLSARVERGSPLLIELQPGQCFFTLRAPQGWEPGDQVLAVIGDHSRGGPGAEVAHHPTYGPWPLLCTVDQAATGHFLPQPGMPTLQVLPEQAAQLLVRVRPQYGTQPQRDLQILVTDRFGNCCEGLQATFSATALGSAQVAEDALTLAAAQNGVGLFPDSIQIQGPGTARVAVARTGMPETQMAAVSHPIATEPSQTGYCLFWGDLHGHSFVSDGTHSPDFYYRYGREEGLLDFCALTDHDTFEPDRWQQLVAAADRAYVPGRYTTFLGYEWSGDFAQSIVVYFQEPTAGRYVPGRGPHSRRPPELLRRLSGCAALVIRHDMPPLGSRWRSLGDGDSMERLVEIYSPFHTSEVAGGPLARGPLDGGNSVQAALAAGLRLGFVACSDSHLSMPGRRLGASKGSPGYQPRVYGLTGVYAAQNSREAIFAALRARRCYAATDRILLDVHLDGEPMGAELQRDGPRRLSVQAAGTAPFAAVELLRNGSVIQRTGAGAMEVDVTWSDDAPPPSAYYYVRLLQQDGGMAWSSPIWVDPPQPGAESAPGTGQP